MRLAGPVEGVVGVELPRHGRVGDLLHADGDVHVSSTPRLPGAPIEAPGRRDSCLSMPSCSKPASAPVGLYRRTVTSTAAVEVLVVGAGPAGTAAGIAARRLGLDVLVVDKARFPRDKTCGDGLTAGALRGLEALGLDVRKLPSYASVTETVLVSPSGRRGRAPAAGRRRVRRRGDPRPSSTPRSSTARATRRRRCATASASPTSSPTTTGSRSTSTTARRSAAQWVIAADGHYSPVRRMLDADGPARVTPSELGTWHAFRQYFRGVDDRAGVGAVRRRPPARVRVGVPARRRTRQRRLRRAARSPQRCARRASSSRRSGARSSTARSCATSSGPTPSPTARTAPGRSPRRSTRTRLTHGRVLFAGDAANVVDPMTGEGIAQALDTGVLAAHAIAEPMPLRTASPRGTAATSSARSAPTCGSRARSSTLLRSPLGARATIGAAGLTPWTRRNFARWMFEDYPRAALLTPRRWHRGMFTRLGRLRERLTPYTRAMAVTEHWLRTPHWSTDIPLDTPHPRLDVARRARLRRAPRPRPAGSRVGVPRARVHGLEERRRHQLRPHRHRRRRARVPRLLEGRRPAPRQGRPLHVERGAVPDARRRGAVGRRQLRPRAHDQARAPGLRRPRCARSTATTTTASTPTTRAGSCARGPSSPTSPTAS